MADRLFDLQPTFGRPVREMVSQRTGKPLSKRTLAARALEQKRLGKMHGLHGHGPEGQTCKGCVHLLRGGYLKCELYGVTSCESSDWRAKWPACGKFKATDGAPAVR